MGNTNRQSRLDTLKIREAEGTLTQIERETQTIEEDEMIDSE